MSRIEQIRKLLAVSPNDTLLLYSLGMELLGAEQAEQALAAFARVLELDADYLAAYSQSAAALRQMGDIPAAAAMLQRGLEVAARQGDRHAADRIKLLLEGLGYRP